MSNRKYRVISEKSLKKHIQIQCSENIGNIYLGKCGIKPEDVACRGFFYEIQQWPNPRWPGSPQAPTSDPNCGTPPNPPCTEVCGENNENPR